MELPQARHYGIECVYCGARFFRPASQVNQLLLMVSVAFRDYHLPNVLTPSGLVVGYGLENYNHACNRGNFLV